MGVFVSMGGVGGTGGWVWAGKSDGGEFWMVQAVSCNTITNPENRSNLFNKFIQPHPNAKRNDRNLPDKQSELS